MRQGLKIDQSVDILEHVHSLPSELQRDAHSVIEKIEEEAMVTMVRRLGLTELKLNRCLGAATRLAGVSAILRFKGMAESYMHSQSYAAN
jgi:hypothetical protein